MLTFSIGLRAVDIARPEFSLQGRNLLWLQSSKEDDLADLEAFKLKVLPGVSDDGRNHRAKSHEFLDAGVQVLHLLDCGFSDLASLGRNHLPQALTYVQAVILLAHEPSCLRTDNPEIVYPTVRSFIQLILSAGLVAIHDSRQLDIALQMIRSDATLQIPGDEKVFQFLSLLYGFSFG